MANLSPMMQQYFEIKDQYPNTLLFFRLGDFYEMFFDDAKVASRELELTLTGRDCGLEERAPMCGVPFHSYEGYVAKLVNKGYKVAICEQMEDPALAKGLVKRDIVRVITPGTVLESSMLEEGRNNYICSLCVMKTTAGICFADISTGEVHASVLSGSDLTALQKEITDEFARFSPSEILLNPEALNLKLLPKVIKDKLSAAVECRDETYFPEDSAELLQKQFGKENAATLRGEGKLPLTRAMAALITYLSETQMTGLERMKSVELYSDAQFMRLDANTRRNLELIETMRNKEKRGTLLWVLDKTKTAMGKRLIRSWIEKPLVSPAKIVRRLNAVEELFKDQRMRDALSDALSGIFDMERVMTRIVYGSANGRELRSLASAAERLPAVRRSICEAKTELLQELCQSTDELSDLRELIDSAIVEEPPFTIRDGGVIRKGYSEELDSLTGDRDNSHELITQLEAREKERTGIPKLRINYNRVFGYYIEIANAYKDNAPEDYIRKQTLANCERFVTPELKELEDRILGASDRSIRLETELFEEVRKKIASQLDRVQQTAQAVAALDVLCSYAQVSVSGNYVRPDINVNGRLLLKESRHPVIEKLTDGAPFVPNDVTLDKNEDRVAIITGPNMAGKSTYMRQTALIVLMAQIGCFVPAQSADIGIVDGIYTRVGASDDLASGQSTFMVEMTEVADILKNATKDSLLIFDEIGRGTSTFDGMSIARAVLEYVADPKTLGAKTMFATHYHELTALEELIPGVKNYNIAVKKRGDDITFLRRIIRGGTDESYGIEVAKLAGVPSEVIRRAKSVLAQLDEGAEVTPAKMRRAVSTETQMCFIDPAEEKIKEKLKNLDVNTLTPIECMNRLFELAKLAQE